MGGNVLLQYIIKMFHIDLRFVVTMCVFYVYLLYGVKFPIMFPLTGVIKGGYKWLNLGNKRLENLLFWYQMVNNG